MKKIILSIILSSIIMADNYWDATDYKPYFKQRDNQAHIAVSVVASSIATYYANKHGLSKTESWFIGFGTAVLIGTIKELSDKNFSKDDLSSYAVGGAIGSSIIVWRYKW